MDRPKTIFKYEPFTLRSVQNLKASSIYFGSPLNFNDPYDCALTTSIADVDRDELEALREEALTSSAYPQHVRETIPGLTLEQFEAQIRRGALIVLDDAREEFLRSRGVTCFSETNDNLLMWSHYGGQYKGFCLEFRTDSELQSKLQKVQYVDDMPQFQLSDFVRNQNHDKLLGMFCTKSSAWSYEKEWRAIHEKAGTLYGYKPEDLKAIYFGPEIENQDHDLLCQILHCQNPSVELWLGTRSTTAFRVEFERVPEYVPYAVARERGLV